MPILQEEPCLFPDSLFDVPEGPGQRTEEADSGAWWVLHTRPRAEKALARRLYSRNIAFFLPLYQKRWRNGSRRFVSQLPLFPGYVFLYGGGVERVHALESNCVAGTLSVVDQPRLYSELRRIRQLSVSGVALKTEDQITPGERVVVVRGPLAGMRGKVIRRANALRFVVEIEMLHQGVSADIDQSMLQTLDG
jgi:transcriptional antiterminator RfaH